MNQSVPIALLSNNGQQLNNYLGISADINAGREQPGEKHQGEEKK